MLPKPSSCRGCPFYGNGQGFVPDELKDRSEVFIIGQNPGEQEEQDGKPFVGKTGQEMERTYFPQAGLSRDQVSLGNALRCRYRGSNVLPQLREKSVQVALQHCAQAHFKLPESTRLIVTQGEYALYSMTQVGLEKYNHLADWRGYVLPYEPIGQPRTSRTEIYVPGLQASRSVSVLATYHIAYTFRDPVAQFLTKVDWRKIPKILAGTWPGKLSPIKLGPPSVWPVEVAFDTEYNPVNRHFLCYSLYDGHTLRVSEELDSGIISLETMHTVIMHNAPADISFIDQMLPKDQYKFEDTMLAHAVLWSDFDHDLGFLGSIYGSLNRWKHLDQLNPKMYAAADAFATWESWQALKKELARDPGSTCVYEIQKQLVPIIMMSEEHGIRVDPVKSKAHYEERLAKVERLRAKGQAIAGWPINVRSDEQVANHLFTVERLIEQITGIRNSAWKYTYANYK